MSINKSEIINILSNNYPNFKKKDLKKIVEIFINEIKNALKRHERIELRDVFSLETKLQKAKIARNPKTNEKVQVPEKIVHFKMSKKWFTSLNND